ncbi:uncharacterized protein LOC113367089 [Ctenocephalides felis]|uniref:uncharacterized protein LOC113367089 n=1 Tax=Ctenocephalides felis TaxID=7515 RepID=UPI000E6E405F|nr:uncharacterized protein LOC113367089 [Ctenocephalides felis]
MEFAHWRPIGRGDPLQNDPTFDYVPPVLERVRYWASSDERNEPKSHLPEEDQSQKYHFPHQELRSTYLEEDDPSNRDDDVLESRATVIRRKDTINSGPGFMRFVDAPRFRPRPMHKRPMPATILMPPPAIKKQVSKPAQANALWVDDPSIWLSPPPVGGTTVVPSKEILVDSSTPLTTSETYVTDSIAEESMLQPQSTLIPNNLNALKTLLQKEAEVTTTFKDVEMQTTDKTFETTLNTDVSDKSPFISQQTTASYATTWFTRPRPTTTTTEEQILVEHSTVPSPVPMITQNYIRTSPAPIYTTTRRPTTTTTFRPLMNLIIQGHSKVKTYGLIQNDNSLIAENIRHLHPKQPGVQDQELTKTKHLHDKHKSETKTDGVQIQPREEEVQEKNSFFGNMFENMDFGLGFLFNEANKDAKKSENKYRFLDQDEIKNVEDVQTVQHLHFGNEDKEEVDTSETLAKKRESMLVSLQGLVDSKSQALSDDIINRREKRIAQIKVENNNAQITSKS